MSKILFVHQSTELYGSDKSILGLIEYILECTSWEVVLILPTNKGVIYNRIEAIRGRHASRFVVFSVPVIKLSRSSLSFFGIKKIITEFIEASRWYWVRRKYISGFDLIHTNTVSPLLGLFLHWAANVKHVWNVREIIEKPKFVSLLYRILIFFGANKVVSNSKATHDWVKLFKSSKKYTYIENGVEQPKSFIHDYRVDEFLNAFPSSVVLSVVGRINSWKGQDIAVKSLRLLREKYQENFVLLIVGDSHVDDVESTPVLKDLILQCGLSDVVYFSGYVSDASYYYKISDFVLVPSVKPEPFGRVAIEAMSARGFVIASDHGGLSNIITSDKDGVLVEPENYVEIADKIIFYTRNRKLFRDVKNNAFSTYMNKYTEDKCFKAFLIEYESML